MSMAALPVLVRRLVDSKLRRYCEGRVPARARSEVRVDFSVRGNVVTVFESRPLLSAPSRWIDSKIAQLRYNPANGRWALFWQDRNRRWRVYDDVEPARDLDALIAEIDRDPVGVFWG
jgi:hypothetical protein